MANHDYQRRPPFKFDEMGITIGEKLVYINDNSITATVIASRLVRCQGEDSYLTPLTRRLLKRQHPLNPCRYWTYNGRLLHEIYDETYGKK
jgi:hypothetical protein